MNKLEDIDCSKLSDQAKQMGYSKDDLERVAEVVGKAGIGLFEAIDGISDFIDTVRPFVNECGLIELPSISSDPGDEQGLAYHIYHESRL